MRKVLLITSLVLSFLQANAGKKYFINNVLGPVSTCYWNSSDYWCSDAALTQSVSKPDFADTVYFLASSFKGAKSSYTILVPSDLVCAAIDMTDLDNYTGAIPEISIYSSNKLSVFGSVELSKNIKFNFNSNGILEVKVPQSQSSVDFKQNGAQFNNGGTLVFSADIPLLGSVYLRDSLILDGDIELLGGELRTKGYNIKCNSFKNNNATQPTKLTVEGGTIIEILNDWLVYEKSNTATTVVDIDVSSEIYLNGVEQFPTTNAFYVDGVTYPKVTLGPNTRYKFWNCASGLIEKLSMEGKSIASNPNTILMAEGDTLKFNEIRNENPENKFFFSTDDFFWGIKSCVKDNDGMGTNCTKGIYGDANSNVTFIKNLNEKYVALTSDTASIYAHYDGTTSFFKSANDSSIVGKVTTGITNPMPVTQANVYLYNGNNTSGIQIPIDTVQTDANGDYVFKKLKEGNYYLSVTPIAAAGLPAVYYGDTQVQFNWSTADVIYYSCEEGKLEANMNINPITPLDANAANTGDISGTILEGPGYGKVLKIIGGQNVLEQGANGVIVGLGKQPGGNTIAVTTTNSSGEFKFEGVPLGNYDVFVDIPGLPMTSIANVNVSVNDTVKENIDYYVDSVKIYPTSLSSIKNNTIKSVQLSGKLYPNPFTDEVNLNILLSNTANLQITLTDLLGSVIYTIADGVILKGETNYSINRNKLNLSKGMYFVNVNSANEKHSLKLMCY